MAIRITHVSGYQRGRAVASRTKLPVPAADIEHPAESRNDATPPPGTIPDAVAETVERPEDAC